MSELMKPQGSEAKSLDPPTPTRDTLPNQKLKLLIVERVAGRGLHIEGLRLRALLFH